MKEEGGGEEVWAVVKNENPYLKVDGKNHCFYCISSTLGPWEIPWGIPGGDLGAPGGSLGIPRASLGRSEASLERPWGL